MSIDERNQSVPFHQQPSRDWMNQRELACVLGVSTKTASVRARQGKLKVYEHGVRGCGNRKYSRALVERALRLSWQAALRRLDDSTEESQDS